MHFDRFPSSSVRRRLETVLWVGLLAVALVLTGCDSNGNGGNDDGNTITELAASQDNLSTLVSALEAAGLDDDLNDDGSTFTVFAPVNGAFDAIETGELTGNSALLEKILQYHVVAGQEITSDEISDGQTVTTLQGGSLEFSVSDGTVQVDGATVTTVDLQASNGVVHLIDGVLLRPANVVERASISPNFSILTDLVGRANLASALSGPGPDGEDGLTVFAPTDQAFLDALDSNDNGSIDDGEIPSNAASILQYHVLDDVFFAGDVPTSETPLSTLEGSDVTVVRSGSDVSINPNAENASVVAPDVEVSNGVIHGIDTVLSIPSSN